MNKETFGIGILTLTAMVLAIANWFSPPSPSSVAFGAEVLKDRDIQVCTARIAAGGDALYILNREGTLTVFTYDPNTRRMLPRASQPMAQLFANARG
jgi:hypothetical protein